MSTGDAPQTDPPGPGGLLRDDNFGCFALILIGAVVFGMLLLFDKAGPTGTLGAGIASLGLALLGVGVVWVAGRRR